MSYFLACLDNVTLLNSVLGSGNNTFLANEEIYAPASQQFEKEPRGGRKLKQKDKKLTNQRR